MASAEELNAHMSKILVEACTNISFEVTVELKGEKPIRGRIDEVVGHFDHDRRQASATIRFTAANSAPRRINIAGIDRIARAP